MSGHRSIVTSCECHPYGDYFATGSLDTNVKVWDTRRKNAIQTYKGHTGAVNVLRFSPDGKWLASGSEDGTIRVWDLSVGKVLRAIPAHDRVHCMEFHPNEFLLASGGNDRLVKFWDLETFECASTSDPDATRVNQVVFSPGGEALLSATNEGLRVWTWEPSTSLDFTDASWTSTSDLIINPSFNQLIGASLHGSLVRIWTCKLSTLRPFSSENHDTDGNVDDQLARHLARVDVRMTSEESSNASSSKTTNPLLNAGNPFSSDIDRSQLHTPPPPRAAQIAMEKAFRQAQHSIFPSLDDGVDDLPSNSNSSLSPSTSSPSTNRSDPKSISSLSSTFIKPPSEQPLGLDPRSFLVHNVKVEEVDEDSILHELLENHSTMCGVYASRLTNVKVVRALWQKGDVKGALDALVKLGDAASQSDIVCALFADDTHLPVFKLDHVTCVLPLLRDLMDSEYSEFVTSALRAVLTLFAAFAPVIQNSMVAAANRNTVGLDIAREDRAERATSCMNLFLSMRVRLEVLVRRSDDIGNLSRIILKSIEDLAQAVTR